MITAQQLRQLEEASVLTRAQLMENAGRSVFLEIAKLGLKDKKVLVVCYHGNNAGDGFVAARYICEEAETDILFLGDEGKMKKETLINYRKVENNERVQFLIDEEVDFGSYDLIIDAILGIGFRGRLNREISAIIDDINNSGAYKVSIDIPTGVDPDSGNVSDKCVNADLIITFHDIKPGLMKMKDKVVIADIGL